MDLAKTLHLLLGTAWLLPLASFALVVLLGPRMGKRGKGASYVATGAIFGAFLLSVIALAGWVSVHGVYPAGDSESAAGSSPIRFASEEGADAGGGHHASAPPEYYAGDWYTLAEFGDLSITIGYHIDALTVVMFTMVSLISMLIHFYAIGYMGEELDKTVTDHEVTLSGGEHLKRPGRFHRFFQYLSLFCFSMLGLVIAGNIAMTFVFWELVGICSYFLIGFYIERKSATDAGNKAFIVNRIGDVGMIIGLMALFAALGTFQFGDRQDAEGHVIKNEHGEVAEQGIFTLVRSQENHYELRVPDRMVKEAAAADIAAGAKPSEPNMSGWRKSNYGYGLLIVAGLGIFCGCVGKSAQFPLHTWLPDAMEGPTPVSALVHSATMVAAGVYLVGRFFPVFTPEVLLVIAVAGCITLFMAATIAITATDIKRVLAYSTLSQLGYMMFALGVGGWIAGMLHLITHAFFKSLLFMCAGSVIHAVHTNEMPEMGGLLKKMPVTAWTMFVGCLAIIGAGIPFVIGTAGYYSKDAILAQGLSFAQTNATWYFMFVLAAGGASITAFYMFRMWLMTFLGEPRDKHRFEHAHESPQVMTVPLLILAVFAIMIVWPTFEYSPLVNLLNQAIPAGVSAGGSGVYASALVIPAEHDSHAHSIHVAATTIAFLTATAGVALACCLYWWRVIKPSEVASAFAPIYRFLLNKWWFDELYDVIFVKPLFVVSRFIAGFDKYVIDWLIDGTAWFVRGFSTGFDRWIDRTFIDGTVNWIARRTYALGLFFRNVQTGQIRQYVVFIVVGTVVMFIAAATFKTMM